MNGQSTVGSWAGVLALLILLCGARRAPEGIKEIVAIKMAMFGSVGKAE